MSINLNEVIPLGRSFQEYVKMFNLTEADLDKKILDCGGGPSSFNYEMKLRNKHVTSIDPIYEFSRRDIEARIDATFNNMMRQAGENRDKFVWTSIKTVAELANIRMTAMESFLADFESGKKENRYQKAELPILPFRNNEFDIALSSHFLFLYTNMLTLEFHMESIREMLRVANEVRIFPLIDLNINKSPYVDTIKEIFAKEGRQVLIETVAYEFQKGGNQLMKILKPKEVLAGFNLSQSLI